MACTRNRTAEFLACVGDQHEGQLPPLPAAMAPSSFSVAAQSTLASIVDMRNLLYSQRKEYLDLHRHIYTEAATMTDQERDTLEQETSRFVTIFGSKIDALEATIGEDKEANNDVRAHRRMVIISLYDVLKAVAMVMQSMRAIRTQRMQLELVGMAARTAASSSSSATSATSANTSKGAPDDLFEFDDDDDDDDDDDEALPPQEAQALEEENAQMMRELDTNLDQMRNAQQRAVEIANIMSLFSDKVLQQNEQIASIYDATIDSTTHIRLGNQQLRKALDRGVGNRLMVLFVLLLASFSLLFLDWYST